VCAIIGRVTDSVATTRPEQPSLLGVGTVVWLASELMFFGGLFAAYLTLRSNAKVWPPAGVHLELLAATVATLVLIASSGTIHLATKARERGDRAMTQRWLIITFALGAIFLANQVR
jgi:cytochrome c oxidase subunit 3